MGTNGFKFSIRNTIALITVVGVFGLMFMLLVWGIPKDNRDIFVLCIGILLRSAVDPIYRSVFPSKQHETSTP